MGSFFQELKRRKVFRVAAVYAVVAWLLIQVSDVVLPTFEAPVWVNQTIIFLFVLGFIPTLVAAWAYDITPEGVKAGSSDQTIQVTNGSTDRKLTYATFTLVLLVAGFQIADRFLDTDQSAISNVVRPSAVTRVSVNIPEEEFFHSTRGDFDVSPDGSFFVYRGADEDREAILWIKRWDQLNGRPLRNSENAHRPRISPDGTEVVFNNSGVIRIVSIQGGVDRTLIEDGGDGANWSPDGKWIYFIRAGEGIRRIPSIGGTEEAIINLNRDNGDEGFLFVDVLPNDGLVYTVRGVDGGTKIQAANPKTGQVKDLILGKYPIYTSEGYLLFQSNDERSLQAVTFDLDAMEITSPPIRIAEDLLLVGSGNSGNIGVSSNGRLVYRTGDMSGRLATAVWVDRKGNVSEIDPNWITISEFGRGVPSLSPSGDRVAIAILPGLGRGSDIWIKHFDGPLSRITFGEEGGQLPTWTPDGQSIIYTVFSQDGVIWRKRADGLGPVEPLVESENEIRSATVSSDGNWIIYREVPNGNGSGIIYAVNSAPDSEPITLVNSGFEAAAPTLSHDGRWLAYTSDESGQYEIYVQPFPNVEDGKWQLSSTGGTEPVWAHSGRELFFRNSDNEMVVVNLDIGTTFDWVGQQVLFSTEGFRSVSQSSGYDISPDDQRFIMMRFEPPSDTELIMVDNWAEELSQLIDPNLN